MPKPIDSPTHIAMQQASTGMHDNCVADAEMFRLCLKALSNLADAVDDTPDSPWSNPLGAAKLFIGINKDEHEQSH